jgi:hypothetical protein
MSTSRLVTLIFAAVTTVAVSITPAAAQTTTTQGTPATAGPLSIERIPSGWVVAPDVAFTQVNDDFATLAGIYGGWLQDRTFLVGAGGYWLANNAHDFKMAYGGLVMQYLARADRRIGFGVKGLVGGGAATISARYGDVFGTPLDQSPAIKFGRYRHDRADRHSGTGTLTADTRLLFDDVFFLAEPQAQLLWNVTSQVRITFGAGYRITSGADAINDRLRGPIGSIAVAFGGGH